MLRILLLEDASADVEIITTTLKQNGVNCDLACVYSREEFIQSVQTSCPDLILADYLLPAFDGLAALQIAQSLCPDIPFIIVSGVLGEERAIETLKRGATDYILKQRLERLVPAVQRALRESNERRERQRAEEGLRQTDDMLRAVVDASPVAIITVSSDSRIITWNQAAEQIYGWQAHEVIDCPLSLVVEDQREVFDQAFRQVLQNETVTNLELRHSRKDNTFVDVSVSLAPLHDLRGTPYAVVMTATDITLRRRVEAERLQLLQREQAARAAAEQAQQEAEAANRVKDEFLAVLSHELRTPLNAIVGWIKLLRRGTLDSATSLRALEVIDRNALAQTQLIDDLLDISRIIRGKVNLALQPVHLADLIQSAVETFRPAATAKSIDVKLQLEPVAAVSADLSRLQQVLWNLLSNAIKFTPASGQVTVRLQQAGCYAQVEVADTGIGIHPDFLPHLFNYFRQADTSTTRSHGGLGLGLAISRHLMELHGGTIQAESPGTGQGATFILKLPLQSLSAEVQPQPAQNAGHTSLQGVKILVVEDEADTRELVTFILQQRQAEVVSVVSVADALKALEQFHPDILISDIGMPQENGYTLLPKVHHLLQQQGISDDRLSTLALTAYASQEDRQRALAAGFHRHLSKPIDPVELVAVVRELSLKQ